MEKSLFFALEEQFTPASGQPALRHLLGVQLMPAATASYYQNETGDEALLQEFDGYLSYLTSLHLYHQERIRIPLRVGRSDLHAFYVLQSTGSILLLHEKQTFELRTKRGCYFYLPQGDYILEFPAGRSQLFNFYFRGKMFRHHHERHFHFLHDLVEAFRRGGTAPIQSIDFRIGPRTRVLIGQLLERVRYIDLEMELLICLEILALLKISKEKIFEEYEKVYDGSILALRIHEEIRRRVAAVGHEFRIEELPQLFKKSPQYLGKVFKAVFGHSLSRCRKELLTELARDHLLKLGCSTQAAYACGFNSVQQFSNFFKDAAGMRPSEYLSAIDRE